MRLSELLTEERVAIRHNGGAHPLDKPAALRVAGPDARQRARERTPQPSSAC